MSFKGKTALVAAGLFVANHAAAQQAAPPATAPQTEIDEEAPPKAMAGVASTYRTPARDAQGLYVTPNRELSNEQVAWHVRVALNVAALGCRDADERATVAAYNAVLASDKDQLAAASTGTERQYQVKYGAKWRSAHDDNMTRLYNFFAQTTAHDEFCATAKAVLAEAQTTAPADFARLAASALPRLQAPFVAFYARYDSYREELAAWQVRHASPRVMVAVAVAAPTVALAVVAATPTVTLASATPSAATAPAQPTVIAAAAQPSATPTGSPAVVLASVSTLH